MRLVVCIKKVSVHGLQKKDSNFIFHFKGKLLSVSSSSM